MTCSGWRLVFGAKRLPETICHALVRPNPTWREFAEWWHTFAAHEVQSVDGESAMLRLVAAQNVADVVRRWVQAGAASGDVAFWAPHAEAFRSPQAYVQVIDVLLKHQDHVASMGLLMHWLGNESVTLERSEASFGQLAHNGSVKRSPMRDGMVPMNQPIRPIY